MSLGPMSVGWARMVFGAVVASYVVVLGWLAASLPDRVPMHFDASGAADGWGDKALAVALWAGIGALMLGGGAVLARRGTRGRATGLNIPHKDHWLEAGNRDELRVRFEAVMLVFVGWTGLLLVALMVVTKAAADRGGSAASWWVWATLGAYLVGTLLWVVQLQRAFRPRSD